MIRIIGGKRYNTETATFIGNFDNGSYPGDFSFYEESLYTTKSQNYFIFKSGGAFSEMAVPDGNGASGSCNIEAIDSTDAEQWIEAHLTGDEQNKAMITIGAEIQDA